MTVVAFDYGVWSARYPDLSRWASPATASAYFSEATLYLDNTDNSPVTDVGQRTLLLNMVTAHIAALNAPVNDGESQTLVGRISSATEGSVSVSTEYAVPGTAAWWAQTRYGAAVYAATAAYRTMRYIAPVCYPRW